MKLILFIIIALGPILSINAQEVCELKVKLEITKNLKTISELIPEFKNDCPDNDLILSIRRQETLTEISGNKSNLSPESITQIKKLKVGDRFYIENINKNCLTNLEKACASKTNNARLYYAFIIVP